MQCLVRGMTVVSCPATNSGDTGVTVVLRFLRLSSATSTCYLLSRPHCSSLPNHLATFATPMARTTVATATINCAAFFRIRPRSPQLRHQQAP